MSWPPTLEELKADVGATDERNDEQLQRVLDAAVAFVEDRRPRINYTADPLSTYPEPNADLVLGTIRLAARWHERRKAPDGLASWGEMGAGRVPYVDPDIQKMLRIGRWGKAVVG